MNGDRKITEEFYQKKFKQYTKEKDDINETLKKHSQANTKYYELAMNIYELSQRAKEIYNKAKKIEQKRQLIKLVFAKLVVEGSKLTFTYSKAFELLSEAVRFTNSSKMLKDQKLSEEIFEPQEKVDITGQTEHLYAQRPNWLPLKDLFCNRKLEFDISLSDLKIAFDEIGLKQPRFAFA